MTKTRTKRRIAWAAMGAICAAVIVIISLNLWPHEQH
jgi:hypothetical protein